MNPLEGNDSGRTVADSHFDIAIAGAGLGGMASAIFLREAGARVICVEPEPFPHARVGESFDWSTPALLRSLGLPRDQLIAQNVGIYKKQIRLFPLGKSQFKGQPPDWLTHSPIRFEVTTLHADRVAMDQCLYERARSLAVEFLFDRVAGVETQGERVVGLRTGRNGTVRASWFIDASGQARVFAKAFAIPKTDYGRRKVCVWTYFPTDVHYEGTSFYGDDMAEYLSWIWEIPINATTISVGWILPAEEMVGRRRKGRSVEDMLFDELARYSRFEPLLARMPRPAVRATSFRCYVVERVCGPNWVMVGEAASLVDPLTGNGVTAAFRHGKDASAFIAESLARGALTPEQMEVYETNVRRMGHAFNHFIELCAYQPVMRWGLGSYVGMGVYTSFGYLVNALYTRFNPQTPKAVSHFNFYFRMNAAWIKAWELLARARVQVRRPRGVPTAKTVGVRAN